MGLLLAGSAWCRDWWGLSYLCCDRGREVESEEKRANARLDLLEPGLGKILEDQLA